MVFLDVSPEEVKEIIEQSDGKDTMPFIEDNSVFILINNNIKIPIPGRYLEGLVFHPFLMLFAASDEDYCYSSVVKIELEPESLDLATQKWKLQNEIHRS